MRAGIIAAGLGERLKGFGVPKPLVAVAGRPLIHWTVEALAAGGASGITILLNSKGAEVRRSLERAFPRLAWDFLEWDSPSSWESFRKVCLALAGPPRVGADPGEPVVVATADVLARPEDVARFCKRALSSRADAALAVTPFIDDEKPLWADVDAAGVVTAVGEDARERRLATCGLYAASQALARSLAGRSHERLRDFWTAAVREGARVEAVTIEKTIDVDRPEDVRAAERFLKEGACR